jgi:hypothetical protein
MRFKYHTANSKTVVNLKWSTGLAALAKTWAEGNTQQCKNRSGNDGGYGRNIVLHQGLSSELTPAWALDNWENQSRTRWAIPVIKHSPKNTNRRNVNVLNIWRSTEYVGCYTSVNEATKCKAAVCYYAQPGNCGMSGAVGMDADSVAVWTEKVFADPSQKNNCGNLCPPEGCRAIPQSPIDGPVLKPTRKPTRRNDDATKPDRKLSCNWSPTFETAQNHKQACMAANNEYTVP